MVRGGCFHKHNISQFLSILVCRINTKVLRHTQTNFKQNVEKQGGRKTLLQFFFDTKVLFSLLKKVYRHIVLCHFFTQIVVINKNDMSTMFSLVPFTHSFIFPNGLPDVPM